MLRLTRKKYERSRRQTSKSSNIFTLAIFGSTKKLHSLDWLIDILTADIFGDFFEEREREREGERKNDGDRVFFYGSSPPAKCQILKTPVLVH